MHGNHPERPRQGKNFRVGPDIAFSILQRFGKGRARLHSHRARVSGRVRTDDIGRGGMHLGDVSARDHRERVVRVIAVVETILADVLLLRAKVFTLFVEVG